MHIALKSTLVTLYSWQVKVIAKSKVPGHIQWNVSGILSNIQDVKVVSPCSQW